MKILGASLLVISSLIAAHAQQPDYQRLKAEAEKFYSEASYAQAHDLYEKAAQ